MQKILNIESASVFCKDIGVLLKTSDAQSMNANVRSESFNDELLRMQIEFSNLFGGYKEAELNRIDIGLSTMASYCDELSLSLRRLPDINISELVDAHSRTIYNNLDSLCITPFKKNSVDLHVISDFQPYFDEPSKILFSSMSTNLRDLNVASSTASSTLDKKVANAKDKASSEKILTTEQDVVDWAKNLETTMNSLFINCKPIDETDLDIIRFQSMKGYYLNKVRSMFGIISDFNTNVNDATLKVDALIEEEYKYGDVNGGIHIVINNFENLKSKLIEVGSDVSSFNEKSNSMLDIIESHFKKHESEGREGLKVACTESRTSIFSMENEFESLQKKIMKGYNLISKINNIRSRYNIIKKLIDSRLICETNDSKFNLCSTMSSDIVSAFQGDAEFLFPVSSVGEEPVKPEDTSDEDEMADYDDEMVRYNRKKEKAKEELKQKNAALNEIEIFSRMFKTEDYKTNLSNVLSKVEMLASENLSEDDLNEIMNFINNFSTEKNKMTTFLKALKEFNKELVRVNHEDFYSRVLNVLRGDSNHYGILNANSLVFKNSLSPILDELDHFSSSFESKKKTLYSLDSTTAKKIIPNQSLFNKEYKRGLFLLSKLKSLLFHLAPIQNNVIFLKSISAIQSSNVKTINGALEELKKFTTAQEYDILNPHRNLGTRQMQSDVEVIVKETLRATLVDYASSGNEKGFIDALWKLGQDLLYQSQKLSTSFDIDNTGETVVNSDVSRIIGKLHGDMKNIYNTVHSQSTSSTIQVSQIQSMEALVVYSIKLLAEIHKQSFQVGLVELDFENFDVCSDLTASMPTVNSKVYQIVQETAEVDQFEQKKTNSKTDTDTGTNVSENPNTSSTSSPLIWIIPTIICIGIAAGGGYYFYHYRKANSQPLIDISESNV